MRAIAPSSPYPKIKRAWKGLLLVQFVLIAVISFPFADCQNPTTEAGPTTTPEPPLTWFECPDQYSYHPHPANCTQYMICVFGKAYLRACEGGLNWNDQLKICDWPNAKTTCQQVDENTAFRPVYSPVFTPPPPTDEENAQRDEYQTETQGRFRGSQGFSRFKPDEDAAKDQLTSFAGKKVVYYDAPKDVNMGDTSPSGDSAIGQMRPDSDDLGQPATNQDSYSSQRDAPPKKKNTGPQMMPIGQINERSNANRGAPQRMSSWDTGNDEFPQADSLDTQVPVPRPQFKQGPPRSKSSQPPPNAQAPPAGNPPPWAQMALQRKRGDTPPASYADDSDQRPVKQQPPKASSMNPPPWLKQTPQSGRNTPSQPRGNPTRSRTPQNMPNDDEPMPSQNRPQGNFPPKKAPAVQQDYQPPPRRTNQGEQTNRNPPSNNGSPIKQQTYQPNPDSQNDDMPPPRRPQKVPSQGFIPSATRPQPQNQNNAQRKPINQRPPNNQESRAESNKQRSPPPQQKAPNRRGPTDFSISDADSNSFTRSGAKQRPMFDNDRGHQEDSSFGQSERHRFPNPASTNADSESEPQFGTQQRIESRPPSKPSRPPPPPSRQMSNDREDESMNVPTRFGSQSDDQPSPVRSFGRGQQQASQSSQQPSRSSQRPPSPSRPEQSYPRESGSSSRDSQQSSGGFSRNTQMPSQSAGSYADRGNPASVLDELNDGPSKIGVHGNEDEGRDGPSSFDIPNRIWNFGSGGRGMPEMMGPPPQPNGYGIFAGDSGDELDQPSSSNFNFQRFRDFYGGI